TSHLVLCHNGGAVSTMSLTLDAPPAAASAEFVFYGASGVAAVPSGEGGVVAAFVAAIDRLLRNAAAGVTGDPCDVRFGREVVAILAAAQTALGTGCAERPAVSAASGH